MSPGDNLVGGCGKRSPDTFRTMQITVLGAGAWGTALACLARRAGRQVTLWSRDPAISHQPTPDSHKKA